MSPGHVIVLSEVYSMHTYLVTRRGVTLCLSIPAPHISSTFSTLIPFRYHRPHSQHRS